MSKFVESLQRLYATGKVTDNKLQELLSSKKINEEEYAFITAVQPSWDSDLQTFYDEVTKEVGV